MSEDTNENNIGEVCNRCGMGVENYFSTMTVRQKVVICDECCKNFLISQMPLYPEVINRLIKYATEYS